MSSHTLRRQEFPTTAALGACALGLILLGTLAAGAQTFDSGSDGTDGALELTTAGTVSLFDASAFSQPLDADGDGVYHFTTINIASGVIVEAKSGARGSIVWLASGDVQIDGQVDLNGEAGHDSGSEVLASTPGAGGFPGGRGGDLLLSPQPGSGPGGGNVSSVSGGGGAGHLQRGGGGRAVAGGDDYGNRFLLPLVGGSGGGGGSRSNAHTAGGGAGGGALLVASSTAIRIDGSIVADGGAGGADTAISDDGGGGGSGGAIRLVAPVVSGAGNLSALRGNGSDGGGSGSPGRLRIETFDNQFTGRTSPGASYSLPGRLFLPTDKIPLRVTHVNGLPVSATPTGSLILPDVTIDASGTVQIDLEARGIPTGTTVRVTIVGEDGSRQVLTAPLSGSQEISQAFVDATLSSGLSRIFVKANWTP